MSNLGDSCQNQMNEIRSPLQVTCKSQPPSKRKLSEAEKVVQKYRKQSTRRVESCLLRLVFAFMY